ncbi:MAG: MATE family efflux transporter, partial [Acidobacteriota bacterium]
FLMIACWVGLSNGLTSHLSRAMGAGESNRVDQLLQTTWKMITRCLLPLFLALAAAIWLGAGRLGLEPGLARQFAIYGGVTLGGSALTSFWSILPDSLVKAHHDTRSTMWAGIWSNLINISLNTLFLFVFHWGIFGIAFSTVLGRFGGLIYALRKARLHEEAREARQGEISTRLDTRPYRVILALALPSAASFVLMALESGFINGILAYARNATASLAAYSIYYRVLMFALMPLIATSVAALPYTARHFGRGDMAAIRRGFREISLAALAYTLFLVAPACWFGGPALARLLAEEPLTSTFAGVALQVIPVACLASIPFFLCRPTFEGMQRGRPGMWMSALRYLVLTGPLAMAGIRMAEALGYPGFYGLLAGLVLATALTSALFHLWLLAELRHLAAGTGLPQAIRA